MASVYSLLLYVVYHEVKLLLACRQDSSEWPQDAFNDFVRSTHGDQDDPRFPFPGDGIRIPFDSVEQVAEACEQFRHGFTW